MTSAAANLNLWRPPTADEVLSWTDGELYVYGQRGGGDPSISVSYLIWRLDDDGMHTPTTAATDRFPTATDARMAMKNRLANYKRRARMTHKDHPAVHNDAGACPGWFWKTLLYDPNVIDHQGNPHEQGKAFIRIALAPRLGQALMSLTRRKKKRSGAGPELYGQKGLISRLDRLNVLKMVALVRYLETGRGPCPPIMEEIEACSANELWEIISWLGLNTARETWRARSAPEDAEPGFSTADALERTLDMKDLAKAKVKGAASFVAGGASKVGAMVPKAKVGKFIAVSLILGMFLTVGAATVAYIQDSDSLIHTFRTKGLSEVSVYLKKHFSDQITDHRTRVAIAWVKWRNGDTDGSQRIIKSLLRSNPEPYVTGLCNYVLGSQKLESKDIFLALSYFEKAEGYFATTNDLRNINLTKIEKSRAYTFLNLPAKSREIISEVEPLDDQMLTTYLEVRSRIEQEDGNFALALKYSELRLEKLKELGFRTHFSSAFTHIGFIQVGLGNLAAATSATESAIEESIFSGNDTLGYFALCNRVAIRRCSGVDYSDLVSKIMQYAQTHDLPRLIDYLNEAQSIGCSPGT